ncbi:MAG: hypothetical protein K1X85_07285 [Ignavibacteria bacterium]|nr:hypothetical protein [Ignavibacteria bacterium]
MTKSFLTLFIVVLSFIGFAATENANAAASKNIQVTEKSDWLIFTRVVEPSGESFIYIYTEGGVFITKYEEL